MASHDERTLDGAAPAVGGPEASDPAEGTASRAITPVDETPGLETRRLRAAIGTRLFGDSTDAAPTKIGRHLLLEPLGSGGMGVVYTAYDPQLDRRVAIKVLHASAGGVGSERARQRLLREAQAMARLNHPHVIAVHDAGVVDGRVFLAMELIDGGTLASWCEQHPARTRARFDALLDLLLQGARGLMAAHEAGLVHRDLKPANMLVDARGRLRVADFGLARQGPTTGSHSQDDSGERSGPDHDDGLTRAGEIVGTPAYMAPEQFSGSADARGDQWAWCATAWEAAYGQRVHPGTSVLELVEQRRRGAPSPPADRGEVPGWFHRVLSRGLSYDPGARYPSMAALVRDLDKRRRVPRRIAIGFGAVALVGLAAWGGTRRDLPVPAPSPCETVAAASAEVFGPQTREAVLEALQDHNERRIAGTARRVADHLGAYADAWTTQAQHACMQLRARGELSPDTPVLEHPSPRMQCYRDALAQLDVVARAELDGVPEAEGVTLMLSLPDLERCRYGSTESTGSASSGPEVAHALARASVYATLADPKRAQLEIDAAEAALGDGHAPLLRARIELLRASIAHRLGQQDEAVARARMALGYAEDGGEAGLIVEVWSTLADAARAQGDHDDAAFYLERASAAARRGGDPTWLRAVVLRGEAALAITMGDAAKARRLGEEALEAYARSSGPESLVYARMLENHIGVLRAVGDTQAAITAAQRVIEAHRHFYGDTHPDTRKTMARLAGVLEDLGELDRAIELYRAAWEIVRDHPGVDPQDQVYSGFSLAQALGNARRYDEARVVAEDTAKLAEAAFGPDAPMTATVRMSQAALELDGGDPEVAIAIYEGLDQDALGPDEHSRGINAYVACTNLALAYARAERPQDALDEAARCTKLEGTFASPSPLFEATSARFFGEVYQRADRPERARELYAQAVEMFDTDAQARIERAEAHLGIAEIDLRAGHREGIAERLKIVRGALETIDDPRLRARADAVVEALAQ